MTYTCEFMTCFSKHVYTFPSSCICFSTLISLSVNLINLIKRNIIPYKTALHHHEVVAREAGYCVCRAVTISTRRLQRIRMKRSSTFNGNTLVIIHVTVNKHVFPYRWRWHVLFRRSYTTGFEFNCICLKQCSAILRIPDYIEMFENNFEIESSSLNIL